MKIASLTFGSLALLTIIAAACASGSDTPDFGGGSPGGGSPSGTGGGTSTSTSTGSSGNDGGTCAGQPCKNDLDCENVCPDAPANSSNCCDQITLVCYVATTASCPAPTSSSSTGSSSSGMY